MRVFVFLLVIGNLLFLAWTHGYLGFAPNPDAFRMQNQLHPDRIRVISVDEPPPEAAREQRVVAVSEKKPVEACVLVSDLATADAERIEGAFGEKLPAVRVSKTLVPKSTSYWVYIPPVATRKDAESKAAELAKLGIKDYYIVQENGPNNRAISLGLFSAKEAATTHLETLKGRGVRSAKVFERVLKPETVALELRGNDGQTDALRQVVTDVLADAKVEACKSKSVQASAQ